MLRYLLKRILLMIPLLLAVIVILFLLMKLAPGDPLAALVGDFPVPDEYRKQLTEKYRLDDPVLVQLGSYLAGLLQGDFGYSFAMGAPVLELILSRLPATLLLVLSGLFLGSLFGIIGGLASARTRLPVLRGAANTGILALFSIPSFWLAQILIIVFGLKLGWFPTSGFSSYSDGGALTQALDVLNHLVLPVATLTIVEFAAIARIMRSSTLEVNTQDYLVTARLKGLTQSQITRRHVLRNASLPAVTVIGYRFAQALAGAVLTETVFGYPGMGQLLQQAVLIRDVQMVMGIVTFIAVGVVLINLLVDLLYGVLDPRITRQ